jgi:hypothetical protein
MGLRSGDVDEWNRARPPRHVVAIVLACGLAGCAVTHRPAPAGVRPFDFATDTFAFANETVLEYSTDADGHDHWTPRQPPPAFSLRCGVVVRVARQFFLEARFAPEAPRVDEARYRGLIAEVLARSPRGEVPSSDPVVIPGFGDLRSFSAAYEAPLQEAMRSWKIFFARSNWRLIFPFTPANQEETAAALAAAIADGRTPIVRVHRYPAFDMNHAVLLYGVEPAETGPRFRGYDPNDAAQPVEFEFDRIARTFTYPRTEYFGGGPVKVFEMYHGWLY